MTSDIAAAIGQMEGANSPGTLAARNNNPGNLRAGPGQVGTDANGFAIFPDLATGTAALNNQINLNISRGLTLQQFFGGLPGVYAGYAPSADSNNPTQYANFVASQAGIPSDVPLSQLMAGMSESSIFGTSDFSLDPTGVFSAIGGGSTSNPMVFAALALIAVGLVVAATS